MIGRREKKRESTKQDILKAAARLFAAHGFEATSVEEIAEAADVAKGTFYYNFDSKEQVVVALRLTADNNAIFRAQSALIAGKVSPILILEKLFSEATQWSEDNPELAKVFFTRGFELMHRSFMTEKDVPRLPAILPDLIMAAQKAGDLRSDVTPALIAESLMHIFITAQASWVAKGQTGSVVERVRTMIRLLIEGVGSPRSNERKSHSKSSK